MHQRARVTEQRRNVVTIGVGIYDMQGALYTEAACVYFTFPKQKAHDQFHFCECTVEEDGQPPL